MIEKTLDGRSSIANTTEVFEGLIGETIEAVLSGVTDATQRDWQDIILFESGCSFIQHHKGGQWINGKQKTHEIVVGLQAKLQDKQKQYELVTNFLMHHPMKEAKA